MYKIEKSDILVCITLLVVVIFILLQSPLAPFAKTVNGVDSSVYIYTAKKILDGQLMYKDIVDHKGPFLYVLNSIALFVFNKNLIGIWFLELFSLFATSLILYKIARSFTGKFVSILTVISALLSLVPLLQGGNFTEEWALPYISIALYIFISYFKENKPLLIKHLFVLSLSFVLVFMIRANLVVLWAGFGLAMIVKWLSSKEYKEMFKTLSFILLFVILSISPFFIYFHHKGIMSDAMYLMFKFNMFEYASPSKIILIKKSLLVFFGVSFISFLPFMIAFYMTVKEFQKYFGVLLAFIFTAISCSLGNSFDHYFIIFIPLLVIVYAYFADLIFLFLSKSKYLWLTVFFIFFNTKNTYNQNRIIQNNYSIQGSIGSVMSPPNMDKIKNIVLNNTQSSDKILVKGNHASIYLYTDRTCATRFPYPLIGSSLVQEFYEKDVQDSLPKLIIQGDLVNSWDSFDLRYILYDKYEQITTDIENVEIWKLKD